MKFSLGICVAVTLASLLQCYALPITLEEDPAAPKIPDSDGPKKKANTGRSLVAVNEQSQERSSSRFFGPSLSGYPGVYPGPIFPHSTPFQGGFGLGGYPGYSGYPGGFPGGYPGAFPQYPGYGAFSGSNGFGYGLQQQQQQQLQGGGYSSGAFAG